MWVALAFLSALCLGAYDVSKKIALHGHRVVDVLTASILISSVLLSVPLILSRCCPDLMAGSLFYVPKMDLRAHQLTVLKSCIVLSSWVFAYISIKHLSISLVSPLQATRPMWTLLGALFIFDERLNTWQWVGISLAIGSIFVFSFRTRKVGRQTVATSGKYLVCLVLAILIGACSGLYDKYMMRHFDHNAVQVWYTFYQALMMLAVWFIDHRYHQRQRQRQRQFQLPIPISWAVVCISLFLVVSDNVYMLALTDPDSLIAVVSTIRRGGTVIGFAYGLLFLHEPEPRKKIACMFGILAGLLCLAFGSV